MNVQCTPLGRLSCEGQADFPTGDHGFAIGEILPHGTVKDPDAIANLEVQLIAAYPEMLYHVHYSQGHVMFETWIPQRISIKARRCHTIER